ncbi:hypothetical protein D3C78_985190 [compost metagenome]
MLVAAQGDGLLEGPGAVGVEGDARLGEAFGQGGHRFDLFLAAQHAAFQLEVVEAVARVGGLGQAHHRFRGQRCFVAQAEPGVIGIRLAAVVEVGLVAVANVEEVTEHFHFVALLAFAEQRRHRYAQVLAEQVEQRCFQRGDGMDGDAQVEGLQAAAAGIAVGEGLAHLVEQALVVADGLPHQQAAGVFQGLADGFAAGHFAHADIAGVVFQDHHVAGEVRAVGAAEVEQHAVLAGHGDHLQVGDARRAAGQVLLSHLAVLLLVNGPGWRRALRRLPWLQVRALRP